MALLRHKAQYCIARLAGRDERRYLWIQWLTETRKGVRENSMPGNRWSCPGVWDEVPGDPRDKAKAGLHESQSPEGANGYTHRKDACNRCRTLWQGINAPAVILWGAGAMSGKDILRRCTGRLSRARHVWYERIVGSPKGRKPYRGDLNFPHGDRVPVVVGGLTSFRGGPVTRPNVRRVTGGGHYQNQEACEMQSAHTVPGVLRERGRRKLPCDELYPQFPHNH